MFRRASLHFSIGRHKSSLSRSSFSVHKSGRPRSVKKKARCRILRRIFGPHKLLQFFEGKRANHVCCVCVCVHAGTIAGFPFIPETDLRTLLRHYGWDRRETFSKRWWNTFRVTVKRKEEKRESNWPNRVLKRVLRNLPSLCAFLK